MREIFSFYLLTRTSVLYTAYKEISSSPKMIWLRFFRVAGAPSAMSGSLLGLLLHPKESSIWALLFLPLASACFFCFGMGLNDLVDLKKDRLLRPERPLPSGRIKSSTAWIFTISLAIAGLFITFYFNKWIWAFALLSAILAYNLGLKKGVLAGLSIGLCRVFNFSMGAEFESPVSIIVALLLFFHTQAIMSMAKGEDEDLKEIPFSFFFYSILCALLLALIPDPSKHHLAMGVFLSWFGYCFWISWISRDGQRQSVIKAVGLLVISFSLLEALVLVARWNNPSILVLFFILSLGLGRVMKVG